MTDPKPKQPWLYTRVGCAAIALLLAIFLAGIAWIQGQKRKVEAAADEWVRVQIVAVNSGLDRITLSNEGRGELAAFVRRKGDLREAHPYELTVVYSHDVDAFLKQIAGVRGLRSLDLYKTDVTASGIKAVASLPDLEQLSIAYIMEIDVDSQQRLSSVHLKSLSQSLAPLENAKGLKKLTLVGENLPGAEIDELRARLPNCAILVRPPE